MLISHADVWIRPSTTLYGVARTSHLPTDSAKRQLKFACLAASDTQGYRGGISHAGARGYTAGASPGIPSRAVGVESCGRYWFRTSDLCRVKAFGVRRLRRRERVKGADLVADESRARRRVCEPRRRCFRCVGLPVADPVIGLAITAVILRIT